MAIKKVTHPVRRAQPRRRAQTTNKAAPRNNRGATARHSDRGKRAERRTHNRGFRAPSADFALRERTLPGRRFVEFPLVHGKIAEKVQLFTATNFHSLTIEFQDRTSLHLDIEPGFTVNAQFMRSEKGELVTLAEWPPVHISSEQR